MLNVQGEGILFIEHLANNEVVFVDIYFQKLKRLTKTIH